MGDERASNGRESLIISATDAWRAAHPEGRIGLLEVGDIVNDRPSVALEERKRQIEEELRARYAGFARADFLALPLLVAYSAYYKRFSKTYHVQLQLESLVLKGKQLPAVSPAVDANFMAELESLVLTAGHDVGRLRPPIVIDVSSPGDVMVQMSGTQKEIRPGDMIMRDADGIACSIIYGQDARSPISTASSRVLYVVYAPAGVARDAIDDQLDRIIAYVRLATPAAVVLQRGVLSAGM